MDLPILYDLHRDAECTKPLCISRTGADASLCVHQLNYDVADSMSSCCLCCEPVVVYVHYVRSIMQMSICDHAVSAYTQLGTAAVVILA